MNSRTTNASVRSSRRASLTRWPSAVVAAAFWFAGAASAAPACPAAQTFGDLLRDWNVGTGPPNGGFNVCTGSSPEAETALRSQDYMVGPSANDGLGGNYYVAAGERAAGSGLANWNLDLSIYSGEGPIVGNLLVFLDIDWDPGAGQDIETYDVSMALKDLGLTGVTLYQASENLGFGYWNKDFDPFATGVYDIGLSAYTEYPAGLAVAARRRKPTAS